MDKKTRNELKNMSHSNEKVCNALLTLGADPNATNKISKTPLIYAAAEGHVKVLEVLVKCPNIDLEAKGELTGIIFY